MAGGCRKARGTILLAGCALAALGAVPAWAQESPPPTEPVSDDRQAVVVEGVRLTVGGQPVEAAPAGVEVRLETTLVNTSDRTLTGIKATFEAGAEGVRVIAPTVDYPDLTPGTSAPGAVTIVIDEASCPELLGMIVQGTSSVGAFGSRFEVPTACPGPKLFLERLTYRGGDGDQAPEPGERLEILVLLTNGGRDAAQGISATLSLRGEDATVVRGTASWPDLAPQASAESTTPFVIEIAIEAKVQEGCQGPIGIEPGVILETEPRPASPDTAVSSSPSGGGTEPATGATLVAPAPGTPPIPPGAEPVREDLGVALEATLAVATAAKPFTLEFSSQIVCALAEGVPAGVSPRRPGGEKAAGDEQPPRGGVALPVAIAALAALAAAGVRFALGRWPRLGSPARTRRARTRACSS